MALSTIAVVIGATLLLILIPIIRDSTTQLHQRKFIAGFEANCSTEFLAGNAPDGIPKHAYDATVAGWPFDDPRQWRPTYGSQRTSDGFVVWIQFDSPRKLRNSVAFRVP